VRLETAEPPVLGKEIRQGENPPAAGSDTGLAAFFSEEETRP